MLHRTSRSLLPQPLYRTSTARCRKTRQPSKLVCLIRRCERRIGTKTNLLVVNDGVSALTALIESDAEEDVSEDLYGYLSGPAPSKDQAQLSVLSGKRRIGDTSATNHAPEDAERRNKKSRAKSRR